MNLTQLRESFWQALPPELANCRRSRKRQNDYNATIRTAWCDYVDSMQKGGEISEALANRATL